MDNAAGKKPFNRRAFTSVGLLSSGLLLPVSGLMNHLLQFEPLTRERHFWMSVHDVAAILFVAFAAAHIAFNWRALVHYAKKVRGITVNREAVAAALVVFFVVGLIASHALHVQ